MEFIKVEVAGWSTYRNTFIGRARLHKDWNPKARCGADANGVLATKTLLKKWAKETIAIMERDSMEIWGRLDFDGGDLVAYNALKKLAAL